MLLFTESELLNVLNKIKKELYSKFKINWQMKDKIHLKFGKGSFTTNKLIKNYGMNTNNLNLVLFSCKDSVYLCRDGKYEGRVNLAYNFNFVYYPRTKKDFEQLRKNCGIFLLISIDLKSINLEKSNVTLLNFVHTNDIYNTRFKIKTQSTPFISRKVFLNNSRLSTSIYYNNYTLLCSHYDLRTIDDKIDKSGYYKPSFQQRLQNRLSLHKHNKVVHYIKDHSQQDINLLRESLKYLRIKYSKAILTMDKADRIKALENNVSLPYLYQDVESVQTFSMNTVNASDKYLSYSDINSYLTDIKRLQFQIEKSIEYVERENT